MLLVGVGLVVFLGSIGCANYGTTAKVNTLYNKVNDMNMRLVELEKNLKKLDARLNELKNPPGAELVDLKQRIEQINEQYIHLAGELSKTQVKVGVKPIEVTPPTSK